MVRLPSDPVLIGIRQQREVTRALDGRGELALVVFNNFTQVLPQHVLPAMIKSGASFMLCGAALVLVPMSFQMVWNLLPATQGTFVRALIASSVSAYFLIAHARFMGLLYLASRARIGWEE